jgi:hypothetical protein
MNNKIKIILKRVNLKRKSRCLYLKKYDACRNVEFIEDPFDAMSFSETRFPFPLSTLRSSLGFLVRPVRADYECYKYLKNTKKIPYHVPQKKELKKI